MDAQYTLMVFNLSLQQLNAMRTFLQSVGLHCATENYRELRDAKPAEPEEKR